MQANESGVVIRNLMDGMTKKTLAELTGMSENTLKNYLWGTTSPSLERFCTMLDVLGYEIDIREKRK